MNFFANKNKSLVKKEHEIEPRKLYYSSTKSDEFVHLRGVQEEVLEKWHDRRDENELLIKMNTGAGKTLVGLLMLYSKMQEHKKPTVFLCPDNQLLNQVLDQSKNYNIPTAIIDEDRDFPESFLNADAVLVTTISRMFNGKNVFDRDKVVPIAIVIDDAHKCVEKVKDAFTVKIPDDHDLYSSFVNLFKNDLKRQSLGSYEAIISGAPHYYMKVPFWSWLENQDRITELLVQYIDEKETLLFKWNLLNNNLAQYEMYINARGIEISPMVSFSKNVVAYNNAKHKYALSATFVNDSAILQDLNFSLESVLIPITPRDRKDYGQRLILAPKRYYNNISDKDQINILLKHLDKGQNVVVLVPSYRIANQWQKIGAEVADKDCIDDVIEKLRASKGNFVVFVNRYEGIDLSGSSCNVLVIHDHPKFNFLRDSYQQDLQHETSNNIIAQTIEQGMGRSVRSSNDFSVIYLMGRHILKLLRSRKNLEYFNSHTRKQLELGLSLMEGQKLNDDNVVDGIVEIADYCLRQDSEWLNYYSNFMDEIEDINSESRELKLRNLDNEKKAIHKFIEGDYGRALSFARDIQIDTLSPIDKALHYQLLANIIYPTDKNMSNDYLVKSKSITSKMPSPFLSHKKWKLQLSSSQIKEAIKFYNSFTSINDLLLFIKEIDKDLVYNETENSEEFEEALFKLGNLLGFISSRPEKESNEGPDGLWGTSSHYLILEAKSEKLHKNRISKSNVEQLYHSIEWFKEKFIFEGLTLGISWQPNNKKMDDVAINESIRVVDVSKLDYLKKSLNNLLDFLSKLNRISELTEDNLRIEFTNYGFNVNEFILRYLKKIK